MTLWLLLISTISVIICRAMKSKKKGGRRDGVRRAQKRIWIERAAWAPWDYHEAHTFPLRFSVRLVQL